MVAENPEDRNGYWENELCSLGVRPKRKNELNNRDELRALTDNLKQVYYQNFKLAYNQEGSDESRFDYII
jgi:hypothetical protein